VPSMATSWSQVAMWVVESSVEPSARRWAIGTAPSEEIVRISTSCLRSYPNYEHPSGIESYAGGTLPGPTAGDTRSLIQSSLFRGEAGVLTTRAAV
jgi:hypothetical protein